MSHKCNLNTSLAGGYPKSLNYFGRIALEALERKLNAHGWAHEQMKQVGAPAGGHEVIRELGGRTSRRPVKPIAREIYRDDLGPKTGQSPWKGL